MFTLFLNIIGTDFARKSSLKKFLRTKIHVIEWTSTGEYNMVTQNGKRLLRGAFS